MTLNQKREATLTTPSPREIRAERIFDAPRERVWRAMTDPALVAQWWGRGNQLVVERFELERGGHWRFVEHADGARHGFEGRFREIVPPERVVQTFEWDGMPGHVIVETMTLEDLGDGRTKLVTVSEFWSQADRDGMLQSGMAEGMNQSYAALDAVLAGLDSSPEKATATSFVRKVAFTMYPVVDVARARRFYEELLGLKVGMNGGQGGTYWVEYDLPGGGCLALTNVGDPQPSASAGGTIALEVNDLPRLIEHLQKHDVQFDALHIKGPRCTMAVCRDSEGNSVLLHQLDSVPAGAAHSC